MGKVDNRIVIVGAGHAGISCAASLRTNGYDGSVTVVDRQDGLPVERPPLSKDALLNGGKETFALPLIRPANWYSENSIDLRTGIAVTSIDKDANTITLSDGASIPYTKLVIATGAIPIELPSTRSHPHSYILRTSKDAADISKAASLFSSAVIIGGGYIGLEVAAALTERGLKVTIVETEDRLLAKISSSIIAQSLLELHERRGVKFKFGNALIGIDQDVKEGFRAVLKNGDHETAEMLVTGVGVNPDSFLASSSSLTQCHDDRNSICVNEHCVTSNRDILAIGDVAKRAGAVKRIESVYNAQEDGKQAAAYIMGKGGNPRGVPWFWSDQYNKTLQIAGLVPLEEPNLEVVVRPGKREDSFSVWSFVKNKLEAVEAFADSGSFMIGKKFLSEGLSPSVDEVRDPSIDLKTIFKTKKMDSGK